MATKFTFPKAPRVGDRIEIVSISENKLPINLVGNSEAGKNLTLIFADQIYTGAADGSTTIATISEKNTVYVFKCVATQSVHTWLLEGTCLNSKIKSLENRISEIETALEAMVGE